MTQRTHDLAAIAFVSYVYLAHPPVQLNWETLLGMGIATFLGGLIPDIDNVASPAWKNKLMPWESREASDFLSGHRHLSHSLLGIFVFTFVFGYLLKLVPLAHLDGKLIQQAFFLGELSHLIADSFTIQGVPWLYPVPFKFGFPPLAALRIKTGGLIEKIVVFPGLLILLVWEYYTYHEVFTKFLKL